MQRSHSRSSYPLDKPLPVFPVRENGERIYRGAAKRCLHRLHGRKQRQHNRALVAQGVGEGEPSPAAS